MILASTAILSQIKPHTQTSGVNSRPKNPVDLEKQLKNQPIIKIDILKKLWLKEHRYVCESLPHQYYQICIKQIVEEAKRAGPSKTDNSLAELPSALLKHPNLKKALEESIKICEKSIHQVDYIIQSMIDITKPLSKLLPHDMIKPPKECHHPSKKAIVIK